MRKGKVKFKDGTTGTFDQQTNQLTMYQCQNVQSGTCKQENDKNPNSFLTEAEFTYGMFCTACLVFGKRSPEDQELHKLSKQASKGIGAAFAACLMMSPDIMSLEKFKVNYLGIIYDIEVYIKKGGHVPNAKISESGNVIYNNSEGEQIGKDILNYCKDNKNEKGFYYLNERTQ